MSVEKFIDEYCNTAPGFLSVTLPAQHTLPRVTTTRQTNISTSNRYSALYKQHLKHGKYPNKHSAISVEIKCLQTAINQNKPLSYSGISIIWADPLNTCGVPMSRYQYHGDINILVTRMQINFLNHPKITTTLRCKVLINYLFQCLNKTFKQLRSIYTNFFQTYKAHNKYKIKQ
jgi:hypothetical protein